MTGRACYGLRVQTLAVGSAKAGNDPRSACSTTDRDRLLLTSAKHTAGHRKYGRRLGAWRRYAAAFRLARS